MPFFLYLAFNAVHTPLQTAEKYLQRFANIKDQRRRAYGAMLSAMDDAISLVMTKLEQTGKLNDNHYPPSRSAMEVPEMAVFDPGIALPGIVGGPGVRNGPAPGPE